MLEPKGYNVKEGEKAWEASWLGGVPIRARWWVETTRANPRGGYLPPQGMFYPNLVVTEGLEFMASRIGSRAIGVNSTMSATAVGTISVAATFTDVAVTMGEVDRKLFSSVSLASNVWIQVTTFGGGADAVTSVNMVEAGTLNSAQSGLGQLFQRVVYAAVTLADSDFLKLQLETQVGSF